MEQVIFERAEEILAQRRSAANAENDRRIREVNEKIPEIKAINDALYNTGHDLLRLISSSPKQDISGKLQQLQKNNLEAQNIARQLLISRGYPADYLNVRHTCPICCDTGYIGSTYCKCLKEILSRLSAEKLNAGSQLRLSSFDSFSLSYYKGDDYRAMERILAYTRAYAEQFHAHSESILMFGNTGLGKTHISLAIANEVIKKGFSVVYDSVISLLQKIQQEHFSYEHSTDTLDQILAADLLILDDLGTEYESKFYNSVIYNIVNSRLIKEKPVIMNTNMTYNELSARYGGKVASRVVTMYTCLEFRGDDVRLQKKSMGK